MTDKKFNYEKIAQALNEADLFLRNRARATPTPLNTFDIAMMFSIAKTCCVSLDLINRQKAEIKRYKRYYYRHEYDKWEKEIKAEAYKEFAKFLIDKSSKGLIQTSDLPDYVKEMVGEEE